MQPFYYDRKGEVPPGQLPYSVVPGLSFYAGALVQVLHRFACCMQGASLRTRSEAIDTFCAPSQQGTSPCTTTTA